MHSELFVRYKIATFYHDVDYKQFNGFIISKNSVLYWRYTYRTSTYAVRVFGCGFQNKLARVKSQLERDSQLASAIACLQIYIESARKTL